MLTDEEKKINRQEAIKKYYFKNKTKILESQHKRYSDNKEVILNKQKNRYFENKEMFLDRNKNYRIKNKIQISENQKKYASTEAGKNSQALAKYMRRVRERGNTYQITSFDRFCISEAKSLQKLRESLTGIKWHVDHIVPVSKGGSNNYHNLQLVPAQWNQAKSNKNTNLYFTKQEVTS